MGLGNVTCIVCQLECAMGKKREKKKEKKKKKEEEEGNFNCVQENLDVTHS